MKRIGIKDVAAAAGVSATTVSHILNAVEGKRINAETRATVLRVADELGYRPNKLARGLRTSRTYTVGFISDGIATTPHAGQIIQGAQDAGSEHDLLLLMLNTGGDPELERKAITLLIQHGVDGILYASMYHRIVEVPAQLRSVPTVLVDASSGDSAVPSVVPDEEQGGKTAAQTLLAHGHRRIGFVTNVDDIPASRGRLAGYRAALADEGIEFDPALVAADRSDAPGGYRAARTLLTSAARPTALFCFNDRMAMGAYRAAGELGLPIPAELSVIGFDNQELISENLHPALSTVALPHYEMGARAIALLQAVITTSEITGPAVQEVLRCPLVTRDSIASPSRS
ncbi:LacI family DNA-binding transcriptional regulator [Lentzea californiensis]|uniref:LacI family DNA-binding transcriptional regulator n=1 Tax=Lentzea californiensis TaxID=438851 RepID=UPI0021660B2A|nr:LacI family DNA-binding transcriptional regulator [Lentzea californiensis]MCR3752234.1 transcriptional regulator, LacI family [Lentzea californiensis]